MNKGNHAVIDAVFRLNDNVKVSNAALSTISTTLEDMYDYNVNTTLIDGNLGASSTTLSVDTRLLKQVDIVGHADAAYHFDVQFSPDNALWYRSQYDVSAGSSGDFHVGFATGVPYVRLKNRLLLDISVTAHLCGKH